MEVTKNNFKEALPLVERSIEEADFLVIDCEFTGLLNGRDPTIFDTPSEYYSRLLAGSSEFMLVQFGLCAFHYDENKKVYMNESYNFYLFPQGRPGPERIFQCSTSSLCFLVSQGFDFNKLIKDGISYMTEPVESKMRDTLLIKQRIYQNKDNITIPDEHKKYVEDICQTVRQFIDNKEQDVMDIDKSNAFQRKLLFQELSARFKNEVYLETIMLENRDRILKVSRISASGEEQERNRLRTEREWDEFEDAVGFTKVARMISQSNKLVIGHNMILDVIHTLSHFFQPLPSKYNEFKEFAHFVFPRILDTKYMSNLPPFKDKVNSSVLPHLLSTLANPPFQIPKSDCVEGRGYSQSDDKAHEAGYDAYITGLCFLSMYSHLLTMRGEQDNRIVSASSAILKPFMNKLFLARTAYQDSPYIHLNGDEPSPSRDHVFYLTFPKDWLRSDINQLFSPFGPITVQFLDETSALVALSRREGARDIMKNLGKSKTYTIIPFVNYKSALLKGPSEMAPRFPERVMSPPVPLRGKATTKELSSPQARKVGGDVVTPTKTERKRSISSSGVPTQTGSRKRTSSGVFHVESEPPAKKPEQDIIEGPRTYSEVTRVRTPGGDTKVRASGGDTKVRASGGDTKVRSPGGDTNVRSSGGDKKVNGRKTPQGKVIERFTQKDDVNVNKSVKAFQESDSWD